MLTAETVLALARSKQKTLAAPGRRAYPLLEALVGGRAVAPSQEMVPAFSGRPLPAAKKKQNQVLRQRLDQKRELAPRAKFQELIEATVKTLLVTASADGDLAFRADIDAEVMNDLSLEVMMGPGGVVITFYTGDHSVRRLLQGYERELVSHLESHRVKVEGVRFAGAPDPDAPTAVPLHQKKIDGLEAQARTDARPQVSVV